MAAAPSDSVAADTEHLACTSWVNRYQPSIVTVAAEDIAVVAAVVCRMVAVVVTESALSARRRQMSPDRVEMPANRLSFACVTESSKAAA